MTAYEFVLNVLENDQEGIDVMTTERAEDVLGWMRSDDEDGVIPADLTAEEFTRIWNEIKGSAAE